MTRAGLRPDGCRHDALRAAQVGVLAGLAIMTMESRSASWWTIVRDSPEFLVVLLLYWCLKSGLVAYVALRLERRHRGARLVAWLLVAAVGLSAVSMAWLASQFGDGRFGPAQPMTLFCYDAWGMLFYGSLLAVGCIVARRAGRTARLLKQAEIDRGLTEALVAEIRLEALQGSVNPQVLYDALEEVARRYAAASPAADRLLDGLVGFLRMAMPGLREQVSTLTAETELARSYMRLRGEMDPARGAWHIEVDEDLGALRFPSLQLVQLLDRWAAAMPQPLAGTMAITRCDGGVRVELSACPAPAATGVLLPVPEASTLVQFFNTVRPLAGAGSGAPIFIARSS